MDKKNTGDYDQADRRGKAIAEGPIAKAGTLMASMATTGQLPRGISDSSVCSQPPCMQADQRGKVIAEGPLATAGTLTVSTATTGQLSRGISDSSACSQPPCMWPTFHGNVVGGIVPTDNLRQHNWR